MRWLDRMSENIRKNIRNWLQINPAPPTAINIQEFADYELSAIRNMIWYRGDANELSQLYSQTQEYADQTKFWASSSTEGMEMRKIHTGLPALIVRVLSNIVLADMNDFDFKEPTDAELWKGVDDPENPFIDQLESALHEILVVGDGAWKITFDTDISQHPLLEWYAGDRVEYKRQRGRLREVIFRTPYRVKKQQYVLLEHYGRGYVRSELYLDEKEVPLDAIEATKNIVPEWKFDDSLILAVPFKIYNSAKFKGRGASIFDNKLDSFDAFDEAWSQWMDALRSGRAKTYIPETLIPRDPETGMILKPNAFDNRFIASGSDMSENAQNRIVTEQPGIPHDSYLATYITALDLCLQGIISPSTLGIDTKKLDNAEAQREKEKTTLYTRNAIVGAIQGMMPILISACVNADRVLHNQSIREVKVDIPFGEYANPSFESQVETVAKAKTAGIMSIEASVEELYGDTRDQKWKEEEIERLKEEQGIAELEEPEVRTEAAGFAMGFQTSSAGEEDEEAEEDAGQEDQNAKEVK